MAGRWPPLPIEQSPVESTSASQPELPMAPIGALLTHPVLQRPLLQAVICVTGYLFHVCFLSKRSLGRRGPGLDTVAGLVVMGLVMWERRRQGSSLIPTWIFGHVTKDISDAAGESLNLNDAPKTEKIRLLVTAVLTLLAPLFFAFLSPVLSVLPYLLALVLPVTESFLMGARLLVEQLTLYYILFRLIGSRHAPFFRGRWVRWGWKRPWLAPVLGGYTVSLTLFNLIEPLNQALLPHLAYAPDGPVALLANPADKSLLSLLIASITPCLGAPVFEEVQSRAFVLQALTAAVPLRAALVISGFLFGLQHLQLGLLLPLSVTGFFWGVMYVYTGNLLVPILIHALWNARVFLGSYWGL